MVSQLLRFPIRVASTAPVRDVSAVGERPHSDSRHDGELAFHTPIHALPVAAFAGGEVFDSVTRNASIFVLTCNNPTDTAD